jgi:xylulokinase
VGLTLRHGRAHMTRAVMEGVAFSMRDGLEVMRGLGTPDEDMRAVGGGARSPLWLALQADVYGRTVRRTEVDEGPAYGAALLGGVAAGVFADVGEASEQVRLRDEVTEPDGERAKRYDELHAIYASLYGALRDPMHALGRLAGG